MRGDRDVSGSLQRLGDLRRQAKLPRRQSLNADAGFSRAADVILGATPREMEDDVDRAGAERGDQLGPETGRDILIDDDGTRGDATLGQLSFDVGGAILPGKIKMWPAVFGAFADQPHEIAGIAVGGMHVLEPGIARGLGAARTDRVKRQFRQRCELLLAQCADRIGAGNNDG